MHNTQTHTDIHLHSTYTSNIHTHHTQTHTDIHLHNTHTSRPHIELVMGPDMSSRAVSPLSTPEQAENKSMIWGAGGVERRGGVCPWKSAGSFCSSARIFIGGRRLIRRQTALTTTRSPTVSITSEGSDISGHGINNNSDGGFHCWIQSRQTNFTNIVFELLC